MKPAALATLTLLAATPAFAHVNIAEHSTLVTGLSHPVLGLDHILAMVAVGLWAALLAGRGLWALPCAFVGSMVIGFSAANTGLVLPVTDPMVLVSVFMLGLAVALALRLSVGVAAGIVAMLGLFHGTSHADNMGVTGAVVFGFGLTVATAILHGLGLTLAVVARRVVSGSNGLQGLGWLTALGGLWVAFGH